MRLHPQWAGSCRVSWSGDLQLSCTQYRQWFSRLVGRPATRAIGKAPRSRVLVSLRRSWSRQACHGVLPASARHDARRRSQILSSASQEIVLRSLESLSHSHATRNPPRHQPATASRPRARHEAGASAPQEFVVERVPGLHQCFRSNSRRSRWREPRREPERNGGKTAERTAPFTRA